MITDGFDLASGQMAAAWVPNTAEADPGGFFCDGSSHAEPASTNWTQDLSMQYSTGGLGADQWAEAALSAPGTGGVGTGMGVALRMASTSVKTYYRAVACQSGWEFGKQVAGTYTPLASGTTAFADGDTIYLEVRGTTLTAKKGTANGAGGSVLSATTGANPATDGAIASGQVGIAYSSDDNNAKIHLFNADQFALANATASPTTVAATASAGTSAVEARPPPPYTLTTVTG